MAGRGFAFSNLYEPLATFRGMALEPLRLRHKVSALDGYWAAKNSSALPADLPGAAPRNAPAAVFREIGIILAATLGLVLAVDVALIAFGIR